MSKLEQRVASLNATQRRQLADRLAAQSTAHRLQAFAVLRPGTEPVSSAELILHLQKQLPAHALPSQVTILENLPRLPNGKVDRQTLASRESTAPTCADLDGPATEAEATLLAIWQEVLGTEPLSIHDDFFELGGDSILSIQIVSRARSAGLRLSPGDLTEYPNIAMLAAAARESETDSASGVEQVESVPLPNAVGGSLQKEFASPAGNPHRTSVKCRYLERFRPGTGEVTVVSIGVSMQILIASVPKETPVIWLKLDGLDIRPGAGYDIPQTAEAYASELLTEVPRGRLVVLANSYGGLLAFEMTCLLRGAHGRKVELILLEPTPPKLRDSESSDFYPSETSMGRFSRHWRALLATGGFSGLRSYVLPRMKGAFRAYLIAPLKRMAIGWRLRCGRSVSVEEVFAHLSPTLLKHIYSYQPEVLPGSAHLFGRPEYLERTQSIWHELVEDRCFVSELPGGFRHTDIIEPPHSQFWIDLLQRLIVGEGPADSS